MGYSASESIVRADQFKPSGKWYQSIALEMGDLWHAPNIHDAIRIAWERATGNPLPEGWRVVVLEPYHVHSHPIMIVGFATPTTTEQEQE